MSMEFSVLQWNVWFKEDIGRVLGFLREHPADVICLQELTDGFSGQNGINTWEYLARELGYQVHYKDMPIIDAGEEWLQANAILSKFPIISVAYEWISQPGGSNGYDDQYRSCVLAELGLDGRIVTILTTHMSYTDQFAETPAKKLEVGRLTDILEKQQGPCVFTGDLNALPGSFTLEEIGKKLEHAGPNFEQKTWTTKPFSYDGFEAKDLNWRLDYVFYKDLEVVSAEILQTTVSDHLPVLVKFRLE